MDTPTLTPEPPPWLDKDRTYSERIFSLLIDVQHLRVNVAPATELVMALMDEAVEEAIRDATEPRITIVH